MKHVTHVAKGFSFAFSLLAPSSDAVDVFQQEQEKLLAQRKVPGLQSQLEEYKSALCQLQAQKLRLHTEVGHGSIANTHIQ